MNRDENVGYVEEWPIINECIGFVQNDYYRIFSSFCLYVCV